MPAQMRLELGELTGEEFAAIERAILARLRDIRKRQGAGSVTVGGDTRVTGVEATLWSESPSSDRPPSARLLARTEPEDGGRRGPRRRAGTPIPRTSISLSVPSAA